MLTSNFTIRKLKAYVRRKRWMYFILYMLMIAPAVLLVKGKQSCRLM